jgi:uncharacterized protein (TIGR04255 family)
MPLKFPHQPDIRLEHAPLNEVVCQVRFPPILRIVKEDPSEFQEVIRQHFPLLNIEQGFSLRIPKPGSQAEAGAEALAKTYRFQTPDERTTISLAVDFFALSTQQYTHWSDFIKHLKLALKATRQVYKPAYASRIGLRYMNRFTLENTGLERFDQVLDIFQPDLVTLLRGSAWNDPVELLNQLVLTDNDAKLSIRTGFGTEKDEHFFLLDLDYFEEGKLTIEDLEKRVQRYHSVIYDAFRWCVKEESLSIFNPIPQEVA